MLAVSSDQPTRVQGGAAERSGAAEEDEGGVTEHMLLMALESLYKDASEQDVRLGLLRTTLQILQRHGQLNTSPIQVFHSLLYRGDSAAPWRDQALSWQRMQGL